MIKTLVGGALLTSTAFAGEVCQKQSTCHKSDGFDNSVTVGYDSQYIFRGVNFRNDLVSAAVNTAWTCEKTGLDLNAGAWYGSTSDVTGSNNDELDLTVGASKDLGFARVNAGYILYHFFNQGDDAQEVYVGLSKDLACGTSASLTYFWDVESDNNGYTELALEKSCDKLLGKKLDLGVALGYLAEEGQLSHLTAKLSHDVALSETATLTPYIAHSWELNDDVDFNGSTSSTAGGENELFAGVALNVSF